MKLHKRITINGTDLPLVSEDIALDMNRPGRAIFQVISEEDVSGDVAFSLGWHFSSTMTLFFTGEVDVGNSRRVDAKQVRLFCNEVSARLDAHIPLALRHPTLKEVLQGYAGATGLRFILPPKSYANTQVPAFYGTGSGFHGLASLGGVFSIPDYVWLTQGDGQVFVGSHADSMWANKNMEVPASMFHSASAGGRRKITAIPNLRPGAVVNGERLVRLKFSGHTMELQCKNL